MLKKTYHRFAKELIITSTKLSKNLLGTYGTIYYVSNMKKAVDWYKTLGLTPSYESDAWTEFSIDGHSICLHLIDPNHKKTSSGFIILRLTNIKDVVAELKTKHVKIIDDVAEVYPGSGAYRVKVADLDENIVSLHEGPLFSELR